MSSSVRSERAFERERERAASVNAKDVPVITLPASTVTGPKEETEAPHNARRGWPGACVGVPVVRCP